MADYINDAKDNITNVAGDFSKNINNSVNNLSSNVSDLYNDSSPFSNTSNSSLPDSNSILAKFAFLIFMLIFFVIIMKIMVGLITSFFKPDNTPTIVSGTILGTEGKRNFSQNPNSYGAIPILRSHNDNMGIEFTWSTWLNINQRLYQKNSNHKKFVHVFNKGETHSLPDHDGIYRPNNCPGVYLDTDTNQLLVVVSTFDDATESIIITDMPVNKWFSLIIRVEQMQIDVFINGKLAKRHILTNVPKQNYGDVTIFKGNGIDAKLSDLKYFDRAVNLSDINQIMSKGPNMFMTNKQKANSAYNYLSNMWYLNEF